MINACAHRTRRAALGALTLVALGVLACGDASSSDDTPNPEASTTGARIQVAADTPVVLISIDTLRSDRLPAYGYRGVETPAIDALGRDGTLFLHAYSQVPLTLPSHASMLTGRLPYEHGVRDNQGYFLDDRWPTLAEWLKKRGYRTAAAVSSFILRHETGLARGFERYDDHIGRAPSNQLVSPLRAGSATLEPARAWLEQVADQPFFLFFHIYEPHLPYQPDEPFRTRYGLGYDAEVATADRVIGALLDHLRTLGAYQRALIILTSDHGEGLGEHGVAEHGPLLYREVLQVPLIIKLPAHNAPAAPSHLERPAELVDLMPTVLDLLGQDPATEGLPGRPLFAPPRADRMLYAETLFPRLHFGWSELYSLIDYPFHYIAGPDPELYDLGVDPQESHNLLRENRRQFRAMEAALKALPTHFSAPGPVDEETRKQLRALGYAGSAGDVASERIRPDPKSRLPALRALAQAFEHFRQGDCPATIKALEAVVREEREIIDAWEHLGLCHMRLGQPEQALEAYRHEMKLTGGSAKAAVDTAGALLALDRLDEAREHAEMAIPFQPTAYNLLAQIAMRTGDWDGAEAALEHALASAAVRPNALLGKAVLMLHRDDPEAALALIRDAEALAPEPLDGVDFIRGKALARLGDLGPATAAFNRAIERSPKQIAPYSHLALLRGLAGDGAGAVKALHALVEANPTPAAYADAVRTLRLLENPDGARRLLEYARQRWPDNAMLRSL